MTYEDLYAEWGQFYFFLLAFLFSARLAFTQNRYRLFFGLLAVACFYASMEEISWGQRIFDYEAPDFFEEYNLQGETNLHNFLTGPVPEAHNDVVKYVLVAALLSYGVVFPWLYRRRQGLARTMVKVGIAPPPTYFVGFFLMGGALELGLLHYNEAEVAELLLGCAMAFMGAHYWFSHRHALDEHDSASWPVLQQGRFAGMLTGVALTVVSLAFVTTYLAYQSPSLSSGIENRLVNGFVKFAAREQGYEAWGRAAVMYMAAHTQSVKLIARYQNEGNPAWARYYDQKAREFALKALAADPDNLTINRRLVQYYLTRGDMAKVRYLARRGRDLEKRSTEAVGTIGVSSDRMNAGSRFD